MQQSNLNLGQNKGDVYVKPQLTADERDYFKSGVEYFLNDPTVNDLYNVGDKYSSGNYDDTWLQEASHSVFYEGDQTEIRTFTQEMIDTGIFYAIDYQGNKVILTKKLGFQPGQNVFLGKIIFANGSPPLEVVVKFTDTEGGDPISEEIQNWADFIATYTSKGQEPNTPYIDDNFYMFTQQAMIIEKLESITREMVNVDLTNFSTQILDQLQHLHEFACHSDLKPDNIMKRIGQEKYFIIDLGGISNIPSNYGYKRKSFTPLFTSQIEYLGVIITPKYDLLEFWFVLNYFTMDEERLAFYENKIKTKPSWWRYIYPRANTKMEDYMRLMAVTDERSVTFRTYELLNIIMNASDDIPSNASIAQTNPQAYQELKDLGVLF